jgi:hypothetical protein
MKFTASIGVLFFILAISSPVWAEGVPAGDFCDPKKMEECKSKLDALLESIESLRANVLKSQMELKAGRKLTNAEADQMLKNMESIERSWSPKRGYLWDN